MIRRLLTAILAIFSISSCAIVKESNVTLSNPGSSSNELRNSIVDLSREYLGTPYKYGGVTQSGMDCSGLVFTVFQDHNITLPRTSEQQSKSGKLIDLNSAVPGDLIFFRKNGRVFHVGIVSKIERDRMWMIHGSSSKGVIESEILNNSYWKPKYYQTRAVI